ncbi:MAG: hypothetical protein DCC68_02335 [Planctomycetota bacterium]|nr:MAG: hypothetical protein DCC68_02335 [Planctomycetota bacterium]
MLVLSRKKAEQIQIGDNITITVLRVKGSAVQIGVDAPSHVKILRSELSFDPPAPPQETSTRALAPATATAIAEAPIVHRAAARPAPTGNSLSQFRQEMRLLDANRPMPTGLGDRATLADTLVFLG